VRRKSSRDRTPRPFGTAWDDYLANRTDDGVPGMNGETPSCGTPSSGICSAEQIAGTGPSREVPLQASIQSECSRPVAAR